MCTTYNDLTSNCKDIVDDLCDTIILDFLNVFKSKNLETLAEWQEEIYDNYIDDSCLYELDMYERIHLVTNFGDTYTDRINCAINDLETTINEISVYIFRQLSEELASTILHDLKEFMDEYDLDTSNIVEDNNHSWAIHYGETDIGKAKGNIYHYRNLESEQIHVDVYEYKLLDKRVCYFEKYIEEDIVTEEENNFKST